MRKILVILGIITLVVGGLIAILWPVENWRRYDANWRPLAMTEAEAWCSGNVSSTDSSVNQNPQPEAVAACIAQSDKDNTTPSIAHAVRWWCQGIVSKVPWNVEDCVEVVESIQVWPLLHGGYTWEWNSANPRPVAAHQSFDSKTPRGERENNDRDSGGRIGG